MKYLLLILLCVSCGKKSNCDDTTTDYALIKYKVCAHQAINMQCVDMTTNEANNIRIKELLPSYWFYSQYCYERYRRCVGQQY